jgi:hypothetical protein
MEIRKAYRLSDLKTDNNCLKKLLGEQVLDGKT